MEVYKKKQYPFRLGCTSYNLPENILPNVQMLAPFVDDVEIVLFESDDSLAFPSLQIIDELVEIANTHNLTYTIHLPTDKLVVPQTTQQRKQFIRQIQTIIEKTDKMNPFAYILHLNGISNAASSAEVSQWQSQCTDLGHELSLISGLDKTKLCLENLDYPLAWILPIKEECGFSLCLDIGHLGLHTSDWQLPLTTFLSQTRVIHLHGVNQGKDHLALNNHQLQDYHTFFSIIKDHFSHVLTLEMFAWQDTLPSLHLVEKIWGEV